MGATKNRYVSFCGFVCLLLLFAGNANSQTGYYTEFGGSGTVHLSSDPPQNYTFVGQVGDRTSITLSQTGSVSDLAVCMRMLAEDGTPGEAVCTQPYWVGGVSFQTLVKGGTHTVQVFRPSTQNTRTDSGGYKLQGFVFSSAPNSGRLSSDTNGGFIGNGSYSGSIYRGQQDPWTFNANADDVLNVTLTAPNSYQAIAYIFGPNGFFVNGIIGSASGTSLTRKLTASGMYTALVLHYGEHDDGVDQPAVNYTLGISGSTAPPPSNPKLLGNPSTCGCAATPSATSQSVPKFMANTGKSGVGDPITVATGNLFEWVTDYQTTGQNRLEFSRFYNSQASLGATPVTSLGANWRSNYDRNIYLITPLSVLVERPDGRTLSFQCRMVSGSRMQMSISISSRPARDGR